MVDSPSGVNTKFIILKVDATLFTDIRINYHSLHLNHDLLTMETYENILHLFNVTYKAIYTASTYKIPLFIDTL